MCVCACVRVCACARVSAYVCVCACVRAATNTELPPVLCTHYCQNVKFQKRYRFTYVVHGIDIDTVDFKIQLFKLHYRRIK